MMVIVITIKIPVNKPAWLIAHGTANNEVPIMVFQIDNLKKKMKKKKILCFKYLVKMNFMFLPWEILISGGSIGYLKARVQVLELESVP